MPRKSFNPLKQAAISTIFYAVLMWLFTYYISEENPFEWPWFPAREIFFFVCMYIVYTIFERRRRKREKNQE